MENVLSLSKSCGFAGSIPSKNSQSGVWPGFEPPRRARPTRFLPFLELSPLCVLLHGQVGLSVRLAWLSLLEGSRAPTAK
jgi:hypothetical protein